VNGEPFLIVGAGPSGLGAAAVLAEHGPVEVVDRIPVAGGSHGWSATAIRDLVRTCERAGVRFRLGASACSWDKSGQLLVAAPGQIATLQARYLFFAGGLRPATTADLEIVGDRPAGVLPATVAEHLLETRVALWRRPVIIGSGPWASHLVQAVRAYGAEPVQLPEPGARATAGGSSASASIRVVGQDRVTALDVSRDGDHRTIPCDAVILAADPRPVRNVEGALAEPSEGVTFIQPCSGTTPQQRSTTGRDLALQWLRTYEGER
jgi:NADPH-dependent 2,4-dienoyl-CoA reductase/sulfur reductase-like enzyme